MTLRINGSFKFNLSHVCQGMVPLRVYSESMKLVSETFKFLKHPTIQREYELTNQLKRAAISIPANISEGYLRTKKVFYNHLSIAIGSTNEMITLLEVTDEISSLSTKHLRERYMLLGKQIISLRKRIPM